MAYCVKIVKYSIFIWKNTVLIKSSQSLQLSQQTIILTMGKNQKDGKTTKVKLAKDDLAFLVEATKYTKSEIKEWYRSFRKECPAGVLRKADLHSMYLRYGN